MRIVLVDTSDTGHHKYYLSRLLKELRTEGHFAKPLIPGMSGEGGWNARVFPSKRNLVQYLIDRAKWLTEITNHAWILNRTSSTF